MMEEITNIWNMIAPYVAGGTLGGTILISVILVLRSALCKKIDSVKETFNEKKVTENISSNVLDGVKEEIKSISFEQNIQPLVQSELKKVTEEANAYLKQQLKETQEGYNKLLNCVEKLAAYFDNSIGVPDEAKDALKEAIAEAKVPEEPINTFISQVVVEEEQPKEIVIETKQKKSKKKSAEIER